MPQKQTKTKKGYPYKYDRFGRVTNIPTYDEWLNGANTTNTVSSPSDNAARVYSQYLNRIQQYNRDRTPGIKIRDTRLVDQLRGNRGLSRIGSGNVTGAAPVINDMFRTINKGLEYGFKVPIELAKAGISPGQYIPFYGSLNSSTQPMYDMIDTGVGGAMATLAPTSYIDFGSAGLEVPNNVKLPWSQNTGGVETPALLQTLDFAILPKLADGIGRGLKRGTNYARNRYSNRQQRLQNEYNRNNNIDLTNVDYDRPIIADAEDVAAARQLNDAQRQQIYQQVQNRRRMSQARRDNMRYTNSNPVSTQTTVTPQSSINAIPVQQTPVTPQVQTPIAQSTTTPLANVGLVEQARNSRGIDTRLSSEFPDRTFDPNHPNNPARGMDVEKGIIDNSANAKEAFDELSKTQKGRDLIDTVSRELNTTDKSQIVTTAGYRLGNDISRFINGGNTLILPSQYQLDVMSRLSPSTRKAIEARYPNGNVESMTDRELLRYTARNNNYVFPNGDRLSFFSNLNNGKINLHDAASQLGFNSIGEFIKTADPAIVKEVISHLPYNKQALYFNLAESLKPDFFVFDGNRLTFRPGVKDFGGNGLGDTNYRSYEGQSMFDLEPREVFTNAEQQFNSLDLGKSSSDHNMSTDSNRLIIKKALEKDKEGRSLTLPFNPLNGRIRYNDMNHFGFNQNYGVIDSNYKTVNYDPTVRQIEQAQNMSEFALPRLNIENEGTYRVNRAKAIKLKGDYDAKEEYLNTHRNENLIDVQGKDGYTVIELSNQLLNDYKDGFDAFKAANPGTYIGKSPKIKAGDYVVRNGYGEGYNPQFFNVRIARKYGGKINSKKTIMRRRIDSNAKYAY